MTQLERIARMENLLNEGNSAINELLSALEKYKNAKPGIDDLIDYYSSPLWRQDFDDDAAGKLPHDLKRGVLSEDAVYDLISERRNLMDEMAALLHLHDTNNIN